MKNYILVNDADFDGFIGEVKALQATGLAFTFDYIEHVTDKPDSGGWGCARFQDVPPSGRLFDKDDVEYRYSNELSAWTVDGVIADDQLFLEGLYNYFSKRKGIVI